MPKLIQNDNSQKNNDSNKSSNSTYNSDIKNSNESSDSTYSDYDIANSSYGLTRQVLQKIREYMKAQKISMSEFARQTGVSKAWLSKLKNTDANLSLNTATDLLHYMGYTLKLTREGSISILPTRLKKVAHPINVNKFNNWLLWD